MINKTVGIWLAGVAVGYNVGKRVSHPWLGALLGSMAGGLTARLVNGDL